MRGGKSIWLIIGGLIATGLLWPTWEWWWQAKLSQFSQGKPGLLPLVAGMVAAMSPVQQFLYGAAFGMVLAFCIGYAHAIVLWTRRARYSIVILPTVFQMSRPGVQYLGSITARFKPLQMDLFLAVPTIMEIVNIGLDRQRAYLTTHSKENLHFTRASVLEKQNEVVFEFDLWGRWHFWPLLEIWWKLDLSAEPISNDQVKTAFRFLVFGYLT